MLKTSGAGTPTSASTQSDTDEMKANMQKQARNGTIRGKVTRSGMLDGYIVTGWRYPEDASWHVKIWHAGRPSDWLGYTVTAGIFELKTGAQAHKEAVMHVIGEWEAGIVEP
jgi:hypothetical protein